MTDLWHMLPPVRFRLDVTTQCVFFFVFACRNEGEEGSGLEDGARVPGSPIFDCVSGAAAPEGMQPVRTASTEA